jgi:hypothetical protein
MKKLFALVSVAMFTVAGFAANPKTSWVTSENRIMSIKKIRFGSENAFVVLSNGEKMTIPKANLDIYAINGKVYEKKSLYKDGKPTGETAYMELIRFRSGHTLYKNFEYSHESQFPSQLVERYYVYRSENMHLALDEKSIPSVFSFFNLTPIYQ